jgi:hypothetical protein
MLIPIGITVLVVVIAGLAFIGTRPARFRIERSARIETPGDVVFSMIDDFHHWAEWSPWEKIDPSMTKTFDGPSAGAGAIYSWVGNKKVGEGRMTLLESKPCERVVIKLEFFKPFAATNQTTFTLAPTEGGTRVSWCMEGTNGFMAKAFSLFMNMDAMVGKEFEKGLANLDTASRAESKKLSRAV